MVDNTGHESKKTVAVTRVSEEALRSISTFESAIAAFTQHTGLAPVQAGEELGDGFDRLDDKNKLVGLPLFIIEWTFGQSDTYKDEFGMPAHFVVARIVAQHPLSGVKKVWITDGSTGICEQLWNLSERTGRQGGLLVARGLRVSQYKTQDALGNPVEGETFYLDTAAE